VHYLWTILIGFVVGLIARAVLPGRQTIGLIMTTLLGVAGSLIATYIGQAMHWYRAGEGAGFLVSICGAVMLLAVYGLFTREN
jgi:uncharacterized membrane protein YeaQ/YmgE (transglycosylase-associated protein family)